jgi:phosphoenolpyruvate synthase/pyruvate phosphate dikinase/DNA-binding Xre family transcriptional regulator
MITIKLKELSEKLDKTILEIAADTGLNRNTVTALFHNKVDGIKFETIEKICTTYDIPLSQLIEMKKEPRKKSTEIRPYRQEGEAVPFTILTPFYGINSGLGEMFEKNLIVYTKKAYGWFYWDYDEMDEWAHRIYHRYSKPSEFNDLYADYLFAAGKIEKIFLETDGKFLSALNDRELVTAMNELLSAYAPFWDTCLFIDSFDAGFDQKEIKRLSDQCKITAEEAVVLTTPQELFIDRERKLALLTIALSLARKHTGKGDRQKFLKDFVAKSSEISDYKRRFDFYQSNYAVYQPITDAEIVAELEKYLADPEMLKKEMSELKSFGENNKVAADKILRKHGLKTNPLIFFQKITAWRESRKKFNLMGIVVLFRILTETERRTGIPASCLAYLTHDEVESALKGAITRATLERRRDGGAIYITEGRDYKVLYGDEALSIQKELEKKIGGTESDTIITGKVASQGFAKGIVCVVRTVNEFSKFKDGQILVTGMTRPEFVPLMKKAAGIVTNEGGITSHAAIVSRELGKPCIIGTKNATELLHDGDLVEVRALHGTVRILERASK